MKVIKVLSIMLLAAFSYSAVSAQPIHHKKHHKKHHPKHHPVVHKR